MKAMQNTGDSPDGKLAALEQQLELEPTNAFLWIDYGDLLADVFCRFEDAIQAYEQAQTLPPELDLGLRIGSAYVNAGDFETGIARFERTLERRPTPHGYCYLADAQIRREDFDAAQKACERAIALEPEYEEAYFLYGEAVRDRSRPEAITWYRKAIALDPKYALAWHSLGSALIAAKPTVQEGVNALLRAEALGLQSCWNHLFLANGYWKLRNFAEAERYYRAAIEAAPNTPIFHRWYAQFLLSQERRSDAAEHIRAAGSTWNAF